jgi:translation initiation factor IF-2
VVDGEAGGITQHIGAYQIEHNDQKITFIDTPGHAAFTKMRARGAHTTDIAVLIVAADDGFMPQTDEALGYAESGGVPLIVAINKIDTKGVDIDKVKRQMQERNIAAEDWGGQTLTVSISALQGENISDLLDTILLQTEIMEGLKANPDRPAEGIVVEAQKEVGRGNTASLIVQKGTLKRGDALVCGIHHCKVRAMMDDSGRAVKSAPPSMPVRVVGWSGTPESGAKFKALANEKIAKAEAEENLVAQRRESSEEQLGDEESSLQGLFSAIAKTRKKVFRVVVKADVFGTAEALGNSLEAIKSDKIELQIVQTAVGLISKKDVLMASASEAAIVGFNVNMEHGVSGEAKHRGIAIYLHDIIYEIIDIVKDAMADTLEPELIENKVGAAEVRQIFPIGRSIRVAGCLVTEGRMVRESSARVLREGAVEAESKIETIKRFKEDATEVRAGYECGVQLDDFDAYEEGDVIECFEINKVRPSL